MFDKDYKETLFANAIDWLEESNGMITFDEWIVSWEDMYDLSDLEEVFDYALEMYEEGK